MMVGAEMTVMHWTTEARGDDTAVADPMCTPAHWLGWFIARDP